MTTDKLHKRLSAVLPRVQKPARYIGGELNSVLKEEGSFDTRFAFCFPDFYEIGMSYLGLQVLYHILNKTDHTFCERVFAPAFDMEEIMRAEGIPLFTLESKTPVGDADIVGFTLQYELSYTNILNMLDLSGIPLRSSDRGESHPFVMAGGPCAFNSEPLADFFDAILIGDGEELLPEICRLHGLWKKRGGSKSEFLEEIFALQGVYVPSMYKAVYDESGAFLRMDKLNEKAPDRVLKAIVKDIEEVDFPEEMLVPFIETVHDRSVAEIFRGCTRGCRFCQAGMIYRPVRERSIETIERIAKKQLSSSGHEELTLLSLSTSDYSRFKPLVRSLVDMCNRDRIALSLPSLRMDNFSFEILEEVQGARKSGLTFAPEAGTQRLRDVINKNLTEEEILDGIGKAMDKGWKSFKLYFMIGLPTETVEDVEGIVLLTENIMKLAREKSGGRLGRFNLSVSVSNFVPKPFTPFMWARQDSPEEFAAKHFYLKDALRKMRGVGFKYHSTEQSRLEAVFARGDRRLGDVLLAAFDRGCKMDAWSEHFNRAVWEDVLQEFGIGDDSPEIKGLKPGAPLPWGIIDCGVSEEFLRREWDRARQAVTTEDCRYDCIACGVNRYTECALGGVLA